MTYIYQWISRVSIKHKLMWANFMMVLVPVVMLSVVTCIVLSLFRYGDPLIHRKWVMLLPSQMNSVMVQMSMTTIYSNLSDEEMNIDDIRTAVSILEVEGANIVIIKDGQVQYSTPHMNRSDVYARLSQVAGIYRNRDESHPGDRIVTDILNWNGDHVNYIVESKTGWGIYGEGDIPFLTKSLAYESFEKKFMEGVVGTVILLFVLIVILQGMYLSQMISSMILKPLEKLQASAQAIKHGDLNQPLVVDTYDELGETCAVFDSMRQELKHNVVERERMASQRRAMLAGVSHDLATPLTAVKGFASAFKDGIVKTPEQQERYANRIVDKAAVMESLIKQLSDFSRFELNEIPLNLQHMDLHEYMTEFLAERQDLYEERHIHIGPIVVSNESSLSENSMVNIDPMQFERVLTNILENSLKYSPHGESTVDVLLHKEHDKIVLSLGDYGYGVHDSELDKLFDLFYRADKARSNVAKGSGLGLAVARQIVEAMGGHIRALNRNAIDTEKTGLIIEITLPLLVDKGI